MSVQSTDHPAARRPLQNRLTTSEVEVRALRGDRCAVTTPTGRTFTVDSTAADLLRVLELDADDPVREEYTDVLDVLAAEQPAPPRPVPAGTATPTPVVAIGDPATCAELVERLGAGSAPDGPWRTAVAGAAALDQPVVACVVEPDDGWLVDVDRYCADMRVRLVPLELTAHAAWLGPVLDPGRGVDYTDVVARRLSAAADPEVHQALRGPAANGPVHAAAEVRAVLLDGAARALAELPTAPPTRSVLREIVADGTVVEHPVLPLPDRDTPEGPPRPVSDLVDPVVGIVLRTRRIVHHPSVPRRLVTVQTDVADVRRISPWANNVTCQGSAFDDPRAAEQGAIGEAVERYCGNLLDTLPITVGSWSRLRHGPVRAMDPATVVLHSAAQYAAPGFPFVPLDRELEVAWVPGRSLTRDEDVLVPASLVYVNWFSARHADEPLTNFAPFAGIAAGPNLDFAVMSALEEVIERHATMVWWLNGQRLDAVRPTAALDSLWDGAPTPRRRLIHLDNPFDVPVLCGVVADEEEGLLNVGFAARADPEAAAAKAWTEALTLQEGSRDLRDPDGPYWDAMAAGEISSRSYKPWRADDRYLDDYRPDFHDVDDLMVQQQVFLDPRARRRVAGRLFTPETRGFDELPRLPDRDLASYRERVERLGLEVIAVDLTSPDVASTGMRVARVIVPGTVGNTPAAFPMLGLGRVQDSAVELGWRTTPLAESDLDLMPLPHA